MFYIFLAIGLLAALTAFFVQGSQISVSTQMANKIAQELYAQSNMIRAALQECTLEHPEGGGDIAPLGSPDGVIDANDNPNHPWPLNPSTALANSLAPVTAFAGDEVRSVGCLNGTASPTTKELIFSGTNNKGRYLPPPPAGWGEWMYDNDGTDGVSLFITPPSSATDIAAANILATKFNLALCQATWSGSGNFIIWIKKNSCP